MSKSPATSEKATVTLPGTVEKIIPTVNGGEKAQISVEGADELYREIRIDNALQNEKGETVALKQGADVDVTVEAPAGSTIQKPQHLGIEKDSSDPRT